MASPRRETSQRPAMARTTWRRAGEWVATVRDDTKGVERERDVTDQEPDHAGESAPDAGTGVVGAELGVRFVARLIDGVLLWAVFAIIIVPIVVVAAFGEPFSFGTAYTGFGVDTFVAGVIWAVIIVGYFALMESSRGQTVGKMAMKLKTEGPDGQNPPLEMAIKRNAFYALAIIPVIGGLAELALVIYIAVTISQSATNTGWHDTFAGGTRVTAAG